MTPLDPPVAVRILHREAGRSAGPLERFLATERGRLAERHRGGFLDAGATDVRIVAGPPDDTPFGRRLRELAAGVAGGLVVLGSGSLALAGPRDHRRLVAAATGGTGAVVNNRHSADAVALAADAVAVLARLPDLDADNALPRWLETVAGLPVTELGARGRLGVDLDSPQDALVVEPERAGAAAAGIDLGPWRRAIAGVAAVAADPGAELLVAGRASSRTLAWLERRTASRTRFLSEERGLRASSPLAGPRSDAAQAPPRPPASILGRLLDRDGPGAIGELVAAVAEAAIVDVRVLLADRLGPDEADWPPPEDRFAADLLLPDRITHPWLAELTAAAAGSRVPIVLGGHTIVGPGLPCLLAAGRAVGSVGAGAPPAGARAPRP
jgi:hypothetical protein